MITIHKKAIQWLTIDLCPSKFITYAPPFTLGFLFLEKTPSNLGLF